MYEKLFNFTNKQRNANQNNDSALLAIGVVKIKKNGSPH